MVNFVYYHIKILGSIFTKYFNVSISFFICSHQGEHEIGMMMIKGCLRNLLERERLSLRAAQDNKFSNSLTLLALELTVEVS